MRSKTAPKNTNALLLVSGIVLILGGFAIVLQTTHGLTRYPSWNNTITLTVAALMLFIGSAIVIQGIRRRQPEKSETASPRKTRFRP